MRRVVPGEYSSASSSYSYSSPAYQSTRSIFSLNISKQGRNVVILILSGLLLGFVSSLFVVNVNGNGIPALYYLVQENTFVYQGWLVPLVTSIIVAPPSIIGLEDVVFNAIALVFVDRLLSSAFTGRQYYLVFLASGIFGNILTLLNGIQYGSFGASGGIFGLLAGAVAFSYAVSKKVNYSLVMWFLIWFFLSSFASTGVNWVAHVGGALLGLVMGYYFGIRRARYSPSVRPY